MKFKEHILNEYSKSQTFNSTEDMIIRLTKMLDPNSILAKNISKDLGSGYKKDFKKMFDYMNKIEEIWLEISMELDMSNK